MESLLRDRHAQGVSVGPGPAGGITRNGSESHSAYVSALTVYGVSGLIWAIVSLIGFWRKARTGPEDEDPLTAIVKSGCLWAFVAWAIVCGDLGCHSAPSIPAICCFMLVVLVDRASAIAKETALTNAYWDQVMENEIKPIDAVVSVPTES